MNTILALGAFGSIALTGAAFVAGAVVSYLFFRVNPNKRAALDSRVRGL